MEKKKKETNKDYRIGVTSHKTAVTKMNLNI